MKKNNKIYKYKFSVVIPIYNVECYLEETIQSVIRQTIGFKKNIQMILVNDGSPDNSEKICLKYKQKYPDNIIYIKQENSGVSAARNNGMKYIEGKYVNFLDSDDKWSKGTFKKVWDFFEKNFNDVDVVTCRLKFFGTKKGYHPLDFKYTSNRVIDIVKEFDSIQLNGPTAFVKSEIVSKFLFEKKLKYGEDPYWINKIILQKCKYGVVKDGIYFYRKIANKQPMNFSKEYYFDTVDLYFNALYKYMLKKVNIASKYIQALLLYELRWRIVEGHIKNVLTNEEKKLYIKNLKDLINNIGEEVIINNKFLSLNYKYYFLAQKGIKYENLISDKRIGNFDFQVDFFKFRVSDNNLILHGKIPFIPSESDDFCYYVKNVKTGEKIYAKVYDIKQWSSYSVLGNLFEKSYLIKLVIPLTMTSQEFENFLEYKKNLIKVSYKVAKKNNLSPNYDSYLIIDKKCIFSRLSNRFLISKKTLRRMIVNEIKCQISLIKKLKLKTLIKRFITPIRIIKNKVLGLIPLKNIILLESNPDFSDNAKELFEFMIKNGVNKKYKIAWLVSDKSKFQNKKIDNVEFLDFFGRTRKEREKYVEYCYRHAKIILDGNKYIKKINPKQVRIHLNHGSPFKNAAHYNLNIDEVNYDIVQSQFFVPVEAEVRDMDPKKIIPLGFPRNDILFNPEKNIEFKLLDEIATSKKILWLPTYRNHSTGNMSKSALRYGLSCVESEEELLTLNDKLKKEDITLIIKFHPAERTDLLDKCNLSNVLILTDEELSKANVSLYQLFYKVDALITDYSSVYFDFCLTKKNIGLAISDFDNYIKEQGNFQYEYKEAIVGNYMYNNKDLLEFIDDVSKGNDRTYNERMKLAKRYDDYQDGKATERVYEFVKKFL